MSSNKHRKFVRRRQRDYPLPNLGMRYAELTEVLTRRDIQHAVRGGDLDRPGYGLYAPAQVHPADAHLATMQALCRDTDHVLSHQTAAILWEITRETLAPPFHLTSPPRSARVKRPGLVIAHRSAVPEADRREFNNVALTSPERTWVDVAACVPLLEATILADRCRRAGRAEFGESPNQLASGEALDQALARRGRTRGLVTARRALDLSRDGVDSPMETVLRFYMHEAGLPEPLVNVWLRDEHGNHIVQPDLSIWEYRIAIQYEGWEYHSDPGQMVKDIQRQERTEALGWIEVRITREHMKNRGAAAIAKIFGALRKQGWTSLALNRAAWY